MLNEFAERICPLSYLLINKRSDCEIIFVERSVEVRSEFDWNEFRDANEYVSVVYYNSGSDDSDHFRPFSIRVGPHIGATWDHG